MTVSEARIPPLSNVVPVWDHDLGGYPTRVRMAMSDGTIQTFWHEVKQPPPQVEPEYQPKHLKKSTVVAATADRREIFENEHL